MIPLLIECGTSFTIGYFMGAGASILAINLSAHLFNRLSRKLHGAVEAV